MRSPSLSSFLKPALTAMAAMTIGAISPDAKASETSTIATGLITDCIGNDVNAIMSMQGCKTDATLTDGKITSFAPVCSELASDNSMTLPNSTSNQQAISYRGFVVTKYPANNGIVPGYHFYDAQTGAELPFVINGDNYPGYTSFADNTEMRIIEGPTPDKDRIVFLSYPIRVYASPFDANGKPKPECINGPVSPDITYQDPNADSYQIYQNYIFNLESGNNPTIHKLIIGPASIVEDPNPLILAGNKSIPWNPINQGFVTIKDKNGVEKTYITVKASEIATGKDGLYLVNVDDMTDNFATDAGDIAVVDPDKRYMIKSLAGQGKTVIYDNVTGKSAVIAMEEVPQLRGNTTFIATGLNPMWQILSTSGKAYLFQLTDAANMVVDVKEQPFDMFANAYASGGQACTELPNPVVTVKTTVTGGDTGPADVDAGSTDVVVDVPDAGGGSETDGGPVPNDGNDGNDSAPDVPTPKDVELDQSVMPDTEDAADGDIGFTDMNDTKEDIAPDTDSPKDVPLDIAPDAEPDVLQNDAGEEVDVLIDGQNDAPDMSKADGSDVVQPKDDVAGTDAADAAKTDVSGAEVNDKPDAIGGNDAAADAGSVNTPSTPPKTGCDAGPGKAGSSDGALPVAGTLAALAAVLSSRRKEDDSGVEAKN